MSNPLQNSDADLMRPGRFEFMVMNNLGWRIIPDGITEPARVSLTGTRVSRSHLVGDLEKVRSGKQPFFSTLCSCLLFQQNPHCKSAAARQFRVRKWLIPANQEPKRAFPPTMVSFFHVTVSFVPEKEVIGA